MPQKISEGYEYRTKLWNSLQKKSRKIQKIQAFLVNTENEEENTET
jgi:hypothetical protein